jgi:demethylmenaquinone methyltransferase / 2-methoxy-6-polyprenyl-1,4-benzoquinol methylase
MSSVITTAPLETEEAAEAAGDVTTPIGERAVRTGSTMNEAEMTAMFDSIAPVYDRFNTLMTLGADARWRRRACEVTELAATDTAVDVCSGTGKLAELLAERVGPFGRVEAVDLSPEMVERAAERYHGLVQLRFRVGNALALPFADDAFDAATISFGMRNLPHFEAGFRELVRVVRPGGRVVCLELSLPRSRAWARVYHAAFQRAAPLAARLFGGSRKAYRYLPESLEGFPSAERLAGAMKSAGLVDIRFWRLSTGVVTIHRGRVPHQPGRSGSPGR